MSSLTKGTLPGFYDKLWLYSKVKWGGDIGLLMLDPFMLVGLPPAAYTETQSLMHVGDLGHVASNSSHVYKGAWGVGLFFIADLNDVCGLL